MNRRLYLLVCLFAWTSPLQASDPGGVTVTISSNSLTIRAGATAQVGFTNTGSQNGRYLTALIPQSDESVSWVSGHGVNFGSGEIEFAPPKDVSGVFSFLVTSSELGAGLNLECGELLQITVTSEVPDESVRLQGVDAHQLPESNNVLISYDLIGTGGAYEVGVQGSSNGGAWFEIDERNLVGDTGSAVIPGMSHSIRWNSSFSHPDEVIDIYRIRLVAKSQNLTSLAIATSNAFRLDTRHGSRIAATPIAGLSPVIQPSIPSAVVDSRGSFCFVYATPVPGIRAFIECSDDQQSWERIGEILPESTHTQITAFAQGLDQRRFYRVSSFAPEHISASFVDSIPNYSLATGNGAEIDSDNYFLREGDDHHGLDIYYNISGSFEPSKVTFLIWKGDTGEIADVLEGDPALGDGQHLTWTAPLSTSGDEAGFYRVQMLVYESGTEPIFSTPIHDSDNNPLNGWQCPQEGLAVHDLVWKHRPALYIGSSEVAAPNGPVHPFDRALVGGYRLVDTQGVNEAAWPNGENYCEWGSFPVDANSSVYPVFGDAVTEAVGSLEDLAIDMLGDGESPHGKFSPGHNDMALIHPDSAKSHVFALPIDVGHQWNNSSNHVFVQYWMYHASSYGVYPSLNSFNHDGDWEMVQACIRLSDATAPDHKAKWLAPFAATGSQHHYAQTIGWRRLDQGNGGGSPIASVKEQRFVTHEPGSGGDRFKVFIAENAHASYFIEGDINTNILDDFGTQVMYEPVFGGFDSVSSPRRIANYSLGNLSAQDASDPATILGWPGYWGRHHNVPGQSAPKGPGFRIGEDDGGEFVVARNPVRFHNSTRKLVDPVSLKFDSAGVPDPATALAD